MQVAIIDYGSGNLRSAEKSFARAAGGCGAKILVTGDADAVAAADRVVLPGVGAFADCLAGLSALPGMREALERVVRADGRPFLGICVGMQLMATRGLEHGDHDGLGWIEGSVVPIAPADAALKVPHMGWNQIEALREHPLLAGLNGGGHAYFVHSYHFRTDRTEDRIAITHHGHPVTAMVGRDNMAGTQFHPEKSQAFGLRLIENFLRWRP